MNPIRGQGTKPYSRSGCYAAWAKASRGPTLTAAAPGSGHTTRDAPHGRQRADGLLLISGAFACYRRDALLAVGGFHPDCLVENYELTHRLRDHAVRTGRPCPTAVIGGALARTEAPGTPNSFLRQRRRWFGDFLQTQFWYRHMVGSRRHGRLGLMMLPVKALDTFQPIRGSLGAGLLLGWAATGRVVAVPIAEVVAARIAIDLPFNLWPLHIHHCWSGDRGLALTIVVAVMEPFTFQILRHLGAALGRATLLGHRARWMPATRMGLRTSRGCSAWPQECTLSRQSPHRVRRARLAKRPTPGAQAVA